MKQMRGVLHDHMTSVSSDEGCVCTSHDQTTNEKCDNNHDSDIELIPGAAAGEECGLPTDHTLIIIGDNCDKNIKPRDMRSNNQVKSLHLFHSIATTSRVETLHLDDEQSTVYTKVYILIRKRKL